MVQRGSICVVVQVELVKVWQANIVVVPVFVWKVNEYCQRGVCGGKTALWFSVKPFLCKSWHKT
jgi:hypothetical protein